MDLGKIRKFSDEVSREEGLPFDLVLAWSETWDAACKDHAQDEEIQLKHHLYCKTAFHKAERKCTWKTG